MMMENVHISNNGDLQDKITKGIIEYMNEIKKAKIFRVLIEEGYTCMINFYVLNEEGKEEFIQGFGGKKFHTYQDYNEWKNGIENIINKKEKIDEFFEKNNIEHKFESIEKESMER